MCCLTLSGDFGGGLVALEYKISPGESVSVDVNHSETDDMTVVTVDHFPTSLWWILTSFCSNFLDGDLWQNLIVLQF